MTLTASIVVHKTEMPQLQKAVECLLRTELKTLYIIDNSPTECLSAISQLDPRIDYRHVENRGFGAGHNIAIREAVEAFPDGAHLVMNADVWWDDQVVEPLLRYLEGFPETGLIAPKAYYPDGSLQHNVRRLPTPFILFARRFLPGFLTRRRMARYLMADVDHNHPIEAPYLLGCFMLFRNRALLDCGLFDERFFMYPEDIDITRRISCRWRTVYWPGVSIIHEHARGSRRSLRLFAIHTANMIRYFNKYSWLHPTR